MFNNITTIQNTPILHKIFAMKTNKISIEYSTNVWKPVSGWSCVGYHILGMPTIPQLNGYNLKHTTIWSKFGNMRMSRRKDVLYQQECSSFSNHFTYETDVINPLTLIFTFNECDSLSLKNAHALLYNLGYTCARILYRIV